jgi:hypothetical protein
MSHATCKVPTVIGMCAYRWTMKVPKRGLPTIHVIILLENCEATTHEVHTALRAALVSIYDVSVIVTVSEKAFFSICRAEEEEEVVLTEEEDEEEPDETEDNEDMDSEEVQVYDWKRLTNSITHRHYRNGDCHMLMFSYPLKKQQRQNMMISAQHPSQRDATQDYHQHQHHETNGITHHCKQKCCAAY